jgi:hypothetical protein
MKQKPNQLVKRYYNDFAGGINIYNGAKQIKDNESPDSQNCDFRGKSGIGNRQGYTEIGTVENSRTAIYGMSTYKTAADNQLIKFASDGTDIALYSSSGGAWTAVTGTVFSDGYNMNVCQAGGYLFSSNGVNAMVKYNGTVWAAHTGASTGYFATYFAKRLWVVDETNLDTLNFSTEYNDATKPLDFVTNGTSTNPGTLTFKPGSGEEITAIKRFKNNLYVWTKDSIYRITATSTANVFSVELISSSIGCVSYRSVAQVGEDIFFAGDDGIYSIGDVANYFEVRTTNKSLKVQELFDSISGTNKKKLVGVYHKFKYHLFYSKLGTNNDSCMTYDTRYQSWNDWTNIAGNSAVVWQNSSDEFGMYFGEPTTGEVHEMYSGTTDNGTTITSYWTSKDLDDNLPDTVKLYMDTTFTLGALNGSLTFYVIFDSGTVSASKNLSQGKPQGGFGADVFGKAVFGKGTNTSTVTTVLNQPYRIKAKGKKFSIQYKIYSQGADWRVDAISQTYLPFDHYKFFSQNKL